MGLFFTNFETIILNFYSLFRHRWNRLPDAQFKVRIAAENYQIGNGDFYFATFWYDSVLKFQR